MYFKRNLKKKVQKNSGIADIGAFEIGSFFFLFKAIQNKLGKFLSLI